MEILTLLISLRCTNACGHCVFGCSPDRGDHMTWEVFTRAVDIARENKVPKLNFFGGEPLLNPRILDMLEYALERDLHVILATNLRLLDKEAFRQKFFAVTKPYQGRMNIITSRDRFHSQFFDPAKVIVFLQGEGYRVTVNDWSDRSILINDRNSTNEDFKDLDTNFSCCNYTWMEFLGVLPDGGWQICPPYLEPFGNIFTDSLADVAKFRNGLNLHYKEGCTECLKYFKDYHLEFEVYKALKQLKA